MSTISGIPAFAGVRLYECRDTLLTLFHYLNGVASIKQLSTQELANNHQLCRPTLHLASECALVEERK